MATLPALLLGVTPAQEQAHENLDCATVAHMAYQIDANLRLTRLSRQSFHSGGLLYCTALAPPPPRAELRPLLMQLARECTARQYRGVVADLPAGWEAAAGQLDDALLRQGLTLYLPEPFSAAAKRAKLLVSTAISGGTLRQRLESAVQRYGKERVVPALERSAEDFIPPSRTGSGRRLTRSDLSDLRRRIHPNVFWSPELCARYFTYAAEGRTHFVLFDDRETMQAKLRLCGELGFPTCFAVWEELQ